LAALQRVVTLAPFFVVAVWTIFPAPGTFAVVVNTIDAPVILALAFDTVKTFEGMGVTAAEGADAAVCQPLRFARAVNVYAVPTVRLVTLQDVVGLVMTHCFDSSWVAVMV